MAQITDVTRLSMTKLSNLLELCRRERAFVGAPIGSSFTFRTDPYTGVRESAKEVLDVESLRITAMFELLVRLDVHLQNRIVKIAFGRPEYVITDDGKVPTVFTEFRLGKWRLVPVKLGCGDYFPTGLPTVPITLEIREHDQEEGDGVVEVLITTERKGGDEKQIFTGKVLGKHTMQLVSKTRYSRTSYYFVTTGDYGVSVTRVLNNEDANPQKCPHFYMPWLRDSAMICRWTEGGKEEFLQAKVGGETDRSRDLPHYDIREMHRTWEPPIHENNDCRKQQEDIEEYCFQFACSDYSTQVEEQSFYENQDRKEAKKNHRYWV